MYRMLQTDAPDTYVLATGRTEGVRDFVDMTAKALDIGIEWKGTGRDEIGINTATGETIVQVNPKFFRPAEVDLLIGDSSKAKQELDWQATTSLEELCKLMVDADMRRNEAGGLIF